MAPSTWPLAMDDEGRRRPRPQPDPGITPLARSRERQGLQLIAAALIIGSNEDHAWVVENRHPATSISDERSGGNAAETVFDPVAKRSKRFLIE